MLSVFIEPTPQHDEILAALYLRLGSDDDVVINNNARSGGQILPLDVSVSDYSFLVAARSIAAKDCKKVFFSTAETPSGALLLLLAIFLGRKVSFVAHHAEIFGPVGRDPANTPSLKRRIFSILFGCWVRYFAKVYVLSADVAQNCKYNVENLELEGVFDCIFPANSAAGFIRSNIAIGGKKELLIGILGSVNTRRRYYDSLLSLDPAWCRKNYIRFRLVGNIEMWEGKEFLFKLCEAGLLEYFSWSNNKLTNVEFFTEVNNLHAIAAPYATPDYGCTVTSASKVFARAFHKPLLEGFKNFRLTNNRGIVMNDRITSFEAGLDHLIRHLRDEGV